MVPFSEIAALLAEWRTPRTRRELAAAVFDGLGGREEGVLGPAALRRFVDMVGQRLEDKAGTEEEWADEFRSLCAAYGWGAAGPDRGQFLALVSDGAGHLHCDGELLERIRRRRRAPAGEPRDGPYGATEGGVSVGQALAAEGGVFVSTGRRARPESPQADGGQRARDEALQALAEDPRVLGGGVDVACAAFACLRHVRKVEVEKKDRARRWVEQELGHLRGSLGLGRTPRAGGAAGRAGSAASESPELRFVEAGSPAAGAADGGGPPPPPPLRGESGRAGEPRERASPALRGPGLSPALRGAREISMILCHPASTGLLNPGLQLGEASAREIRHRRPGGYETAEFGTTSSTTDPREQSGSVSNMALSQETFNEMRDAVQQARQDMQDLRQQNAALQRQADQAREPQIIRRLGEVLERVAAPPPPPPAQLIQAKDTGKPQAFKNEEAKFSEWDQKLNSYVLSVIGVNFRPAIERAVDQANDAVTPTTAAAEEQFVNEAPDGEAVDRVGEKLSQLYAVFGSLTEGESFDLVVSASQGNGAEALRLPVRRWGPTSGGRRRVLLRKITAPTRVAKLENLAAEVVKLKELVRRYERRRADGRDARLDDEIKMSALEGLAPQDVEMHLAQNRTRLQDYAAMREEVRSFLETRQTQRALGRSRGDPTEIDGFIRRGGGKGKHGKGKGKDDRGKTGIGKGKTANANAICWNCRRLTKARAKDAAMGDTQSTTSTQLPASDTQAGAFNQSPAALSLDTFERALELNSAEAKGEKQCRKCIAMTCDTGAAAAAFPLDQEGECTEADGSSCRAATGEIVEDEGGVGIKGVSEHGESMFLKGRRVNIGKPLLSASATAAKGHFARVGAFGGRVLKESEFAQKIHQMIDQYTWLRRQRKRVEIPLPSLLKYEKGSETAKTTAAILWRLRQRKCRGESDHLPELKLINTRLQVTPHFEIGLKFVAQLEGWANLVNYKLKLVKVQLPYSTAIPGKNVTIFMIKILTSFILHLGYRRLTFQIDGEPAIVALKTAVAVATPTSNGGIEVTVREVKRQVRANRVALEAKLGRKVDGDHPILKWLPQYAAACIGRYRRGTDGLTGEQRRSGRDWKKLGAEFGERVMHRARYVLLRDIEKYGATAGCPGCQELTQKGKITKSHSDECRDRIAVFEIREQLEETKLLYRRPLETAIELLPRSRGAPRWRRRRPEAVEANRALPGSAEETHPTLDELPGHEAMREETQHLQVLKPGSRSNGSMDADFLGRINGYGKGRTFVMIYDLVMFEMRTNANVNDSEQAEEIASLLTEMCTVDTAEVFSPRRFAEMTFRYGLAHGLAVDIDAGWDLRLPEQRKECKKQLKAEILEGETHLNFSMEICKERYKAIDSNGKLGFVRKETGWLTNSELLAEILKGYCRCPRGPNGVFAEYQDDYFIDDLTGEVLDFEGAREARQGELDWCRGRQVWKKVPRREMLENGKRAVTLECIDTNKDDRTQPRYRSRLVAREIKKAMRPEDRPDQAELFSAMPPLEAFKAMVAIFVGRANDAYHDGESEEIIYKFCDISRAHFYGDVHREVYVELPEEETHDDPETMVGRLLKTMHGTVDASHLWQDDYIGLTSSHGFKKGVSNPALQYHAERHIQAEVHGDDFGVIMRKSQEGWFDDVLSRYDFMVKGIMSSRALQEQSVVYLNWVLIWNPFERPACLEADTRRVKKVIRDLGSENAKEVTTPAVKRSVAEILSSNQTSRKLDDETAKTYRSVTMRIMYLSLDRPDISYRASMQARRMKEPKETHMEDLKRIGRYLKKYPERIQSKRLVLKTVDGHWKRADLFTKALDQDTMKRLMKLICFTMKFNGSVRHRVLCADGADDLGDGSGGSLWLGAEDLEALCACLAAGERLHERASATGGGAVPLRQLARHEWELRRDHEALLRARHEQGQRAGRGLRAELRLLRGRARQLLDAPGVEVWPRAFAWEAEAAQTAARLEAEATSKAERLRGLVAQFESLHASVTRLQVQSDLEAERRGLAQHCAALEDQLAQSRGAQVWREEALPFPDSDLLIRTAVEAQSGALSARCVHVSFQGLQRVSPRALLCECGVFRQVQNLGHLQFALQEVQARFEELGVFKSMRANVSLRSEGHVRVAFAAEERRRELSVSTNVDRRGEVSVDARAVQPAVFGGPACLTGSVGTNASQAREFFVGLSTPRLLGLRCSGALNFARSTADETQASSYREHVTHCVLRAASLSGTHTLAVEAALRELEPVAGKHRLPSVEVLRQPLSSAKTSLKYSLALGRGDGGARLRADLEAAVLPGDARFLRGGAQASASGALPLGLAWRAVGACGLLCPLGGRPSCIQDRFFLGGASGSASVVKGFGHHGAGPAGLCRPAGGDGAQAESGGRLADALGGDVMLNAYAALSAPLPALQAGDAGAVHGRAFVFAGLGSLCSPPAGGLRAGLAGGLRAGARASVGVGVAVPMPGMGSLEATLAQPVWAQQHDVQQRWQLGLRVDVGG
ncbi:unnamed protein product [Prorocentrum cordatum]|uniref:RNA-directed RNA polymerase n=1 Tax=Prorocentrum cordatum TaxID=2364126 RepID=A0ABN9U1F0_9DINO|nr:unnamed protein product [Polarella glacialis]